MTRRLRLGGGALARRAGAPTRSRRSNSETAPPAIMTSAPSQISVTSGFHQMRTTMRAVRRLVAERDIELAEARAS